MAELTGLRTETTESGGKTALGGGVHHRGVLLLMALVVLALIPGVAIRLGLGEYVPGAAGQWLGTIGDELRKIDFGRGLRFWLGVAGTAMMAVLLLYPLRKLMGLSRLVSITAWFNLHVVLGITGPALILYHTNFGLGSRPANVALFTTLIVAVSGLVGYFLYTRSSAIFYGLKAHGRASLEDAVATLGTMEPGPTKDRLIEDLRQFDRRMLEERRGLIASTRSSHAIRAFERDVMTRAAYLIDAHGTALPTAQRSALRRRIGAHLRRYFALVRRSERWSIYERLWAKWRLLHLPVFAITVIAATIHVVKVWGIDDAPSTATETAVQMADNGALDTSAPADGAATSPTPAARTTSPFAVRPIRTMAVPADGVRSGPPPALVSKPMLAQRPTHTATARSREPATASATQAGAAVAAPLEAAAPSAVAVTAASDSLPKVALAPLTDVAAEASMPGPADAASPPLQVAPPPGVQAALRPPVITRSTGPQAAAALADAKQARATDVGADLAIAELARRNQMDNRGRFDPATMAARLAQMKEENFDHSKTGFPLTGKHTKVKCESCHKATLKDTKKDCLSCHKKDDVHKGRRPDCAQCHTTTNWTTIIRKR